jgi:hypothetical protein
MSTPKPGQIRCPTCHRSTPPAAFCTQCGAPIPSSARARPRGLDRSELDERIRSRRPGEGFRRGAPTDESPGYVPFTPEPEDALAAREPDAAAPPPRVDRVEDSVERYPAGGEAAPGADSWREPPQPPPPPRYDEPRFEEPRHDEPAYEEPQYDEPPYEEPAAAAEYDAWQQEEEYGTPPPAYAHRYDDGRGGGGAALPIIGFIALSIMALAVGAVLAGIFSGPSGVADATPTPQVTQSAEPSVTSSAEPTAQPTAGLSATPEPSDGPVTFPDGAMITVQPCATREMSFDGCEEDGSTISGANMWVWIGFDDAAGADDFVLLLQSNGTTLDQQEKQLGSLVDCPDTCSGYLIGAAYSGLDPGEYSLVVRRNGDFADRATFVVEGG